MISWALLTQIFICYSLVLIVCTSTILDPVRQAIITATPWLYSPLARYFKNYIPDQDIPHMIECRKCMGIWIALCICIVYESFPDFFIVYGASYFLATQER
jgi:hypothetical protein